jgi:SET domain-containing protein
LIIQYIGEVINDMEQEARAILDKKDPFFAFEIVEKEKLIDAKYFGNKARFINHSKAKNNCLVRNIYSQGNIYIGIFALSDLLPGTERLIDYDGNDDLGKKHRWINFDLDEPQQQ